MTWDALGPDPVRIATSGTTGAPRWARISRPALEAAARASASHLSTGPDDTWFLCLPLHHVGGLAVLARAAHDGSAILRHERFDAERTARALASGAVTCASLVARSLSRTLDALEALDVRPSARLRAVLVGGGPTDEALLQRARERGIPALRTYGCTETCGQVATQRLAFRRHASGALEHLEPLEADTCGRALPGVELRVERAAGVLAGPGEEGEILARGEMLYEGYEDERGEGARQPAEVRDAAGATEGSRERPYGPGRAWFRTGDVGSLDAAGRLTVLDRRTDLVVTGGENVRPARVEGVLAEVPGVAEVCVVGLPELEWGQRVVAVIVPAEGRDPEALARDVERHARARLSRHEVPKELRISREPLPRTELGKVRRGLVRERAAP